MDLAYPIESEEHDGFDHKCNHKDCRQHGRFMSNVQSSRQPVLNRVNRTNHPKRIQQRAENKQQRQSRKIFPARQKSNTRPQRIERQFRSRNTRENSYIFVRASLDAIAALA